jgi:hypothetical protein
MLTLDGDGTERGGEEEGEIVVVAVVVFEVGVEEEEEEEEEKKCSLFSSDSLSLILSFLSFPFSLMTEEGKEEYKRRRRI